MRWMRSAAGGFLLGLLAGTAAAAPKAKVEASRATAVPSGCLQLVVGLSESWNSSRGQLQSFVRSGPNAPWKPEMERPAAVLFGRNGLAWGRGVIPVPHGQNGVPSKQEKDFRAPAGCFRIGTLFGYAARPPQGVSLPFNQVTAQDCWVDDVTSPHYNRHLEIDLKNPPSWYEKQRMRLGDFAYEWMLEIRHNADPPVAGAGSAIFFHIRRGPDRPSAGCTTMAKEDLLRLLALLRSQRQPHYVLLPRAEYAVRQKPWNLPAWNP